MIRQRGFSLLTLLVTLTLGSLVLLATFKAFSHFEQQLRVCYQRYQLATTLQQLLDKIANELTRAGFIYPIHGVSQPQLKRPPPALPLQAPLVIGHYPGEPACSCVLLYHDRNRSGFLTARAAQQPAETIGYRLHHGNLETQRGITNCRGSGWEDLVDGQDITVQRFQVVRAPGARWVQLMLSASVTGQPAITGTLHAVVILENFP